MATVIVPYGVADLSGADVFGNSVISVGVSDSEGPIGSTGFPQLIKIKLSVSSNTTKMIGIFFTIPPRTSRRYYT